MAEHEKDGSAKGGSTTQVKKRAKAVSDAVGDKLREIYDEALKEPVPKDLTDLVHRLSERRDKEE